ncbi:MAG: hypothetical protein RJA07_2176 [Bacteroidota bacterium]|jgi:short-subunit dehydrogenase
MSKVFFYNKVIVITGASSGIGLATAIAALQHNAKVVLAARKTTALKSILVQHNFDENNFLIIPTDVSIETDCQNLIQQTIQKFNGIDILINNAGISMRAAFSDVDIKVIQQLMDINFWGTLYCCKYALPYLIKAKGNIAGISSVAGFKGLPARTGYSASKFAMNGFLESLRLELVNKNVAVSIICPGYTNSNIRNTALNQNGNEQGESPLDEKKLMSAEQVAAEILNAIENRKNFTVLTLLGKATFWLNKFFPTFIDKQTLKLISKETGSPI